MSAPVPLDLADLNARGWDATVRAWSAATGEGRPTVVRAMGATVVTVARDSGPLRLTLPAWFALASVEHERSLMFSQVLHAVAPVGSADPWRPDAEVAVDVSTAGAFWLAGHVHYARDTFKDTRRVYRYSASWVDRMLGEKLRPHGILGIEERAVLLREAGHAAAAWAASPASPAVRSSLGQALFLGYGRSLQRASGWSTAQTRIWEHAFLDVLRLGVVHLPTGKTEAQRQEFRSRVWRLWSPSEVPSEPGALGDRLGRLLDVMTGLRGNTLRSDDPSVRRFLDQCWEAGVTLPASDPLVARRLSALVPRDPALHAELRAHVAHASVSPSPARPRARA